MRLLNKIRRRLGRGIDDGLAEEMRVHRAMLEEQFRAEGLSPEEARLKAAREFGPVALAMESSREEWSFAWLESLWIDARYAMRALSRDKAFAAGAVLTLGVGLALATTAFTLFNAYVLRPFAVTDPDSLYEVGWLGKDRSVRLHTWRDYQDILARSDVFAGAVGSRGAYASGVERHWSGELVTGNYFRMLGARMAIGRAIEERDAQTPLADDVVVLSHGAWKSVFGLDPEVLGKKLVLRGHTFEVIGVTSPEFAGLDASVPDFWAPITMHGALRTDELAVGVIGRLRHGITKAQAEAVLTPLAARDQPDTRASLTSRATAVPYTPMMILVFAPVVVALGLVLATCCANVGNMLLARGVARQREIGIRLSVGAGRGRLIRQLLTEAAVISLLAGLTGIVLARLTLDAGQRIFFATVAPEFSRLVRWHSLDGDYRVFVFALVVAAVAAVGAALVPGFQATRPDLVSAMRGEIAGFRTSRVRDALVVVQVVVCAVLLVCGALLYRRASLFEVQKTGMREHGVINLATGDHGVELGRELRSWPEVEAVAVAHRAPWFGRLRETAVIPSGQPNSQITGYNLVSPAYFRVFDIGLKSGRLFTEDEARAEAPVAIVSQATAQAFWPGEDPIGKTLQTVKSAERHLDNLPNFREVRIVGVVADVMQGWLFEGRDRSCIYLPAAEANPKTAAQMLVLFHGNESTGLYRLRRWIADRWPTFEAETMPMSTILSLQIYPFRAAAWLGWMLGLMSMALSVSGMYGVTSYLVNQRSKEIGIRVALGATPSGVVAMVMRRSMSLAGWGVLIGVAVAGGIVQLLLWWSAKLGVFAWDSLALVAGAGLAGVTATLAALGPSRRAARLDPNNVLRADQ